MTLLTILASTAADDEPTFLSCAGPVDWPTAAAEEVVLWGDADSLAGVEAAVAADPVDAHMTARVA